MQTNQHGNLDTESAKDVIEILKKVAKDKLVIIVTHNIEQIEEYATRIIKMHDGRIIENTEKRQIEDNIQIQESKYNKITIAGKYRLGIRNTFNIISKFLLLFAVFFFITAALLSEYAGFKMTEKDLEQGMNGVGFRDFSDNRILIKKTNKTNFQKEDYSKISNLSNIDHIVEDDLFIDSTFAIMQDEIFFSGNMFDIENLGGKIDVRKNARKQKRNSTRNKKRPLLHKKQTKRNNAKKIRNTAEW